MALSTSIALAATLLENQNFLAAVLLDYLTTDYSLGADLDITVVANEQNIFKSYGLAFSLGEFFHPDFDAFFDLVLLAAGADNRKHGILLNSSSNTKHGIIEMGLAIVNVPEQMNASGKLELLIME